MESNPSIDERRPEQAPAPDAGVVNALDDEDRISDMESDSTGSSASDGSDTGTSSSNSSSDDECVPNDSRPSESAERDAAASRDRHAPITPTAEAPPSRSQAGRPRRLVVEDSTQRRTQGPPAVRPSRDDASDDHESSDSTDGDRRPRGKRDPRRKQKPDDKHKKNKKKKTTATDRKRKRDSESPDGRSSAPKAGTERTPTGKVYRRKSKTSDDFDKYKTGRADASTVRMYTTPNGDYYHTRPRCGTNQEMLETQDVYGYRPCSKCEKAKDVFPPSLLIDRTLDDPCRRPAAQMLLGKEQEYAALACKSPSQVARMRRISPGDRNLVTQLRTQIHNRRVFCVKRSACLDGDVRDMIPEPVDCVVGYSTEDEEPALLFFMP